MGLRSLQPEKIRTYEAVVDQYFLKNYRASLSLYRFEVDDIISQIPDATTNLGFSFFNDRGVTGHGVETEFEARFDNGVLGRVSYTIQKAEDAFDREISNSPRQMVKAGLILPVYHERVFSGFELQYTSSALTISSRELDDYLLLNWNLYSKNLLPGLDMSFGIYNLLNTKYGYPGAEDHLQEMIAQNGRTFRVKMTYHF